VRAHGTYNYPIANVQYLNVQYKANLTSLQKLSSMRSFNQIYYNATANRSNHHNHETTKYLTIRTSSCLPLRLPVTRTTRLLTPFLLLRQKDSATT